MSDSHVWVVIAQMQDGLDLVESWTVGVYTDEETAKRVADGTRGSYERMTLNEIPVVI